MKRGSWEDSGSQVEVAGGFRIDDGISNRLMVEGAVGTK